MRSESVRFTNVDPPSIRLSAGALVHLRSLPSRTRAAGFEARETKENKPCT